MWSFKRALAIKAWGLLYNGKVVVRRDTKKQCYNYGVQMANECKLPVKGLSLNKVQP